MPDDKHTQAIRIFCAKPYSEHGKKRSDGEHDHDWAYLVRQIAYFDAGKTCDEVVAKDVAKVLRKRFPNASDWNDRVNARGAHLEILEIVRAELQARKGVDVDPSVFDFG